MFFDLILGIFSMDDKNFIFSSFTKVMNMSITAGYVILAVMLLRVLLKKLPKKYSYAMWSAVLFRLCCPVSFSSVLSVFNLGFFDMTEAQSGSDAKLTYIPENMSALRDPVISPGIASGGKAIAEPMYLWTWTVRILACVWFVGVTVLLIRGIYTYAFLSRAMSQAVRSDGNVYESELAISPFILGIRKPKIYVPFGLDTEAREYILAHERYHIKRLDHIIKPFAYIVLCFHWINPLCWLAFYAMSRDMEMSCDEKVIEDGAYSKKAYSMALLAFASGKKRNALSPLAFGETNAKSRIKNVLSFKKIGKSLALAVSAVCLLALTAFASNPAERYYFNGVYKLSEPIYVGNEDILAGNKEYAVELTEEREITSLGMEDGSLFVIQRKGLLPVHTLSEYSFDYSFPIEHESFARELRRENRKAWFLRGDCYILLQKDGSLCYVKLYTDVSGRDHIAYIYSLKKISRAKYTDTQFDESELSGADRIGYSAYVPIKFETDFDRIELVGEGGYFFSDNTHTDNVTIYGGDTVYWVNNDGYGITPSVTVTYYKNGMIVSTAEIFIDGAFICYNGDGKTESFSAPYRSGTYKINGIHKYSELHMFIIKN